MLSIQFFFGLAYLFKDWLRISLTEFLKGAIFRKAKCLGRETHRLPPSSVEV
jgi:hypothetical protein